MKINPNVIRKVAIYARKSKDIETSESCIHQINICKNKIIQLEEKNPKYNYVVHDTYIDEGRSGKDLDRPAMQRLINDIKQRKIDVLVIYKMDRLSRKLRDIFELMDTLDSHKVDVVSCMDNDIDTTTAAGRMFFAITMVFAQLERDLASDRNKTLGLEASKTGKYMGGKPPFGYTLTREFVGGKSLPKLIVNESEAPTVRQIFKRYLNGESDKSIAEWLNLTQVEKSKQGRSPNSTGVWADSNIANLITDFRYLPNTEDAYEYLVNEKIPYVRNRFEQMDISLDIRKWSEENFKLQKGDVIGLLIEKSAFNGKKLLQRFDGKITILDAEPILNDRIWIEAQRLRKKKATNIDHTVRAFRGDGPELLTNGMGVCNACGKGVTIRRASRRMKNAFYNCYNSGGFDKDRNPIAKCEKCYKTIRADILDKNIIDKLKEFFGSKDIIEDIINRDKKSRQNIHDEINIEIQTLEKQKIKIEKEVENITNLVISLDGLITNSVVLTNYIKKQEQLVNQLDSLDQQIAKIKVIPVERAENDYSKEELLKSVDSFAELFDYATEAEKKILVRYLVKKVTIESADKFEIELRFFEDFPSGTYLKSVHNNGDTPQGIRIVSGTH